MNQRIKELLRQSTTVYFHGMGEIDEVDQEKFAELLIKEFLEIAHNNLHPQAYVQILAAVQQRFEIT